MSEQSNDVKIRFRSVKEAQGKRGQKVTNYYLNKENVPAMIEALTALQDNEKGVKLMVNLYTNVNSTTGAEFASAEMYVKPVAEFQRTVTRVVPKGQATAAQATAKANTKQAYKNLNKTIA